jgi:hypothetical protein
VTVETHGDRLEALFAALDCLTNEEDLKVLIRHLLEVDGLWPKDSSKL